MMETITLFAVLYIIAKVLAAFSNPDETCPHCGYYCNGKSAWCTKHPSVKQHSV